MAPLRNTGKTDSLASFVPRKAGNALQREIGYRIVRLYGAARAASRRGMRA
jgi:hypothetical protein